MTRAIGHYLDGDDHAEEDFGIGHDPVFILDVHLRRAALGDKCDPAWRLARVGVDYGDEVLGVTHLPLTSEADSPG